MIQVPSPTMELRFKKSHPKIITNVNQNPNGKITLQQKFFVQTYDETTKQEVVLHKDTELKQTFPPQILPHVEMVGPHGHDGVVLKVPSMVSLHIQWVNIPAVTEEEPDSIQVPMPT